MTHFRRGIGRSALPLLFPLFVVFVALPQQQPAHTRSEQALVQLENEWLNVKDVETLDRILADDFLHVLPFGFITKTHELEYRRSHGFPPDNLERRFKDLRVRIYKDTAVVNGVVAASDRDGKLVQETRFTDVFIYRQGRWQAINAQELPVMSLPNREGGTESP